MPNLDALQDKRPELPVAWTSVHAALMSLSYGAFGLSAVAALMYLTQERNLKFHKLKAIFSLMPPIQRLEATAGAAAGRRLHSPDHRAGFRGG